MTFPEPTRPTPERAPAAVAQVPTPLFGPVPAPALHLMSWNIRRRMPHATARPADRWLYRAPALRAVLRAELPAVLCVQEAMPDQVAFLRDSFGERYRWIGRGRDADGGGEGCPIFYDTARLELLDWEQRALSDQPGSPGSRSWGNLIPRILVVATFRDLRTAHSFRVCNTHFDHLSRASRRRSAHAVLELVAEGRLPAVVAGDLNAGAASAAVRELLAGEVLTDSWAAARHQDTPGWGTFPNYQQPRLRRRRIDWILTSPDIVVERVAMNITRPEGRWPSDHLPLHAVITLPDTELEIPPA